MKKFFIQTFGCQMNVYDGWRIASMLEHHGFVRTEQIPDADIIILNTCAVRAKATDKVYSALGRIIAQFLLANNTFSTSSFQRERKAHRPLQGRNIHQRSPLRGLPSYRRSRSQ